MDFLNYLSKFSDRHIFEMDGYPYSIKSQGRYPTILDTPRIRKATIDKDGYRTFVLLDNNGKQRTVFHHRLVLILNNILPTSNTNTQVNHINGNKLDNSLPNLEWCSPAENSSHRVKVLKYRNLKSRKFTLKEATAIRAEYKEGVVGYGITALSKKYKCSYTTMRDIVQLTTYNEEL